MFSLLDGFGTRGEKRKLSVSRPSMSSQELMISGGSERRGLRVKREGGGGVVVVGGSRVLRRP